MIPDTRQGSRLTCAYIHETLNLRVIDIEMARRDSSYLSEESSDASISSLSPLEPMPSRPSGRRLRLTNLFPNWRRTAPHKLPLFKEKSGILTRKLVRSAVILLLITSLALV